MRTRTRLAFVSFAVAVTVIVMQTVTCGKDAEQSIGSRLKSAQVWLLPMAADPSAVLIARDLLYVTVPAMKRVVVLDRQGNVNGQIVRDEVIVAAAYDEVAKCVYMTMPSRAGLYKVDVDSMNVSELIDTPHAYLWMTIAGRLGYANCADAAQVDVVDLRSLKVIDSIPVSARPLRSVAAEGNLYVSSGEMLYKRANKPLPAQVDIVDVQRRQVVRTVTVPGAYPMAMAWDGGRHIYVAANEQGSLVRIDTATGELDPTFEIKTDGRPYDISLDMRRGLAFLSCQKAEGRLSVVALKERRELTTIWAGEGFMGADKDKHGRIRQLFIPNVNAHAIVVIDPDKIVNDN